MPAMKIIATGQKTGRFLDRVLAAHTGPQCQRQPPAPENPPEKLRPDGWADKSSWAQRREAQNNFYVRPAVIAWL